MSRSVCPILLFFATVLTGCSKAPTLSALDPPAGQPHDVVLVQGGDREFAQIVWDAGKPGERVIPGGFFGAFMFSVPPGAAAGPHNVALMNSAGRSSPMTFTVPSAPGSLSVPRPPGPSVPFPDPRIDAVMAVGTTFDSAGVNVVLYVEGANLDVGATVWIQANPTAPFVEAASMSHKVIRNDWFGVSGEELDYPIYHYSSVIASTGVRPPGDQISIIVKNLDGTDSKAFEYKLPSDADSVDSDGDGLLDKWETSGYDANGDGVMDIDLKSLGADPYRRDLFVELDIMDRVQHRPDIGGDGATDSTVFDALTQMFESAPIINLGAAPGIHLVLDTSGKPCLPHPPGPDVCSFQFTMFDTGTIAPASIPDPFTTGKVRFSQLKANSFKNDVRGNVYHYAIWAIQDDGGYSGHSDFADDFLVSFDTFDPPYQTRRSQVEVLAHELGHDLGQHHGGSDDVDYKPNYLSVMSYSWDLRTGWVDDGDRKKFVTCLPFYYASPGAKEVGGAVPSDVNTITNYSEGMARALVRPTGIVPLSTTFCGLTVDWTTLTAAQIEDFSNWRALVFDGPVRNGWLTP